MKASKIKKKILAAVLCAGLVFQSMPIDALADEVGQQIEDDLSEPGLLSEEVSKTISDETAEDAQNETGESEPIFTETQAMSETDRDVTESGTESPGLNETGTEESNPEETETEEQELERSDIEETTTEEQEYLEDTETETSTETESSTETETSTETESSTVEESYIDMENEFPDEVFREYILSQLSGLESDKIKIEDLAEIKEVDHPGNTAGNDIIQKIKGMELLTGVERIDLSYNEIADVNITWAGLKNLKELNLCGNEITEAPNLTENRSLTTVDFRENMMSDSACRRLKTTRLPLGCALAAETAFTQRVNGFIFETEDTYYIVNGQCPIVVKIGGYKSGIEPSFAFTIDGKSADLTKLNESAYVYWIADSGLEEGEHQIDVILRQDGAIKGEASRTFNVQEQDCYAGKDSYRFSINSEDDMVDIYYPYSTNYDKYISRVTFIDEQGREYNYNGLVFNTDYADTDYRYTDIEGNEGLFIKANYMNHTQFSMKNIITELPSGVYTLKAELADQSVIYTLENLIEIRSEVTSNWSYTVTVNNDDGALYYNDPERNTATILVSDNGNVVPVFSTEAENVTITTDPANRSQATVTVEPEYSERDEENPDEIKPVEVTIRVGNSLKKEEIPVKERIYANDITILKDPNQLDEMTVMGIDRLYTINVEVTPAEALEIREDIVVTSSDTGIVVVERQTETDTGISVTLRTKAIGTAEIIAKLQRRDNTGELLEDMYYEDACTVTVTRGSFSDAEKDILRQNVGVLYAITNITGEKLGDVKLPSGWTWETPDTILVADEKELVKYYEAKYTQDSYNPFTTMIPVTVTEITGVTLSGDDELTGGHSGFVELQLQYKGYQIESNRAFIEAVDKALTYSWTSDSLFTISRVTDRKVKVEAAEISDVTDGAVRVSVTAGEDVFTAEFAIRVLTDHITSITITPMSASAKPVSFKFDRTENAVYVDESNVSENSNVIRLVATASMEGENVRVINGTLKWEVNDPNLAKISELSDGTAQLTILQSGTIIVRATAQDVGNKYAELPIEVRDYKPFLEQKSFTINKYSETGVILPVYAVEGNDIINISVDEEAAFKVDNLNGKFVLSLINPDIFVEKTVVKTTMHIRTQMSISVDQDVTITVDVKKPTVTFKVSSAANLFYTDTEAVYSVNSAYDITNIRQAEERTVGFVATDYDRETGLLTVSVRGLTKDTINEFKAKGSELCKVRVLVTYDGYGTHSETLTVSPKNTLPKYKLYDINTLGTVRSAETYVIDSSSKAEVVLPDTVSVKTTTANTSVEKNGGRIKVVYTGKSSKTYKVVLTDTVRWTSDVTASGKFSIVKDLTTQLGMTKLSLNMAHNSIDNGTITVPVSVKNNTMPLERVDYTAADTKTAALLNSGYLQIDNTDPSRLVLGLSSTIPETVKAGTYKFNVNGVVRVNGNTLSMKTAKLSVVIVAANKIPTVKFTQKGSINLVNRTDTSILYTPKISNMTAQIAKVETYGEYAGCFTAVLIDGKIEVKAVEEIPMRTNIKYPLVLKMTFDNKAVVNTTVNIKPVNKYPKIKASATKGTIYKVSANDISWTVSNAGTYGSIEKITLIDSKTNAANANFDMKVVNRNEVVLSLKPEIKRTIKKGKYTVSYQVEMKDAAENAKPVTLKMAVTVK